MPYDYARPRPNPPTGLGVALAVAAGAGLTALGAWGASRLLDRRLLLKDAGDKGGVPPNWLAEVEKVLVPNATVADNALPLPWPGVAFNTLGLEAAEGPNLSGFPRVTQPRRLLLLSKAGDRLPLQYLYATREGEVGFRVDTEALLQRGIAYDVTPDATYADGTPEGAERQYGALITNLSRQLVERALNAAYVGVTQQNDDYSVPSETRDALIRRVLSEAVPSYDWSGAPGNLGGNGYDTGPRMLWDGVSLIAQIANQSTQ